MNLIFCNFDNVSSYPYGFNVHMKQTTLIYILFIPFTIIADLGWSTIFVVQIITFIFFGISIVASYLEDPFGYDKSDLPLDDYCKSNNMISNITA